MARRDGIVRDTARTVSGRERLLRQPGESSPSSMRHSSAQKHRILRCKLLKGRHWMPPSGPDARSVTLRSKGKGQDSKHQSSACRKFYGFPVKLLHIPKLLQRPEAVPF
ncbi:hypothetical protein MRX96_020539 [Rhipicephalus microplus]